MHAASLSDFSRTLRFEMRLVQRKKAPQQPRLRGARHVTGKHDRSRRIKIIFTTSGAWFPPAHSSHLSCARSCANSLRRNGRTVHFAHESHAVTQPVVPNMTAAMVDAGRRSHLTTLMSHSGTTPFPCCRAPLLDCSDSFGHLSARVQWSFCRCISTANINHKRRRLLNRIKHRAPPLNT